MSISPFRHSREGGNPEQLITDNLDVWTSAIQKRGSQGRGSSKKIELYGIKKLRELILELAVRGLLVPQDPKDESATILLEKIEAEKEHLIKEGKLKKQKKLPPIAEEEKPFQLPQKWVWTRLDAISDINGGFAFKSSKYVEQGTRVIRISDFDEKGFKNDKIVRYEYSTDLVPYLLAEKNILMAMTGGTVGKSLLVSRLDEGMVVNQRVATIRLISDILPSFVNIALQTGIVQNVISEAKNSTNDNISMSDIKGFFIALPPENQVSRIVAKVDELMALCDQLEQQSEDSLSAHQTLVETLLNALLDVAQSRDDSSSKESAFDQAWQRIAEHFDTLFTTEHSIDQLKQTILQLAVMGKLVPQDPNDEPVSLILNRIKNHEQERVKNKEIQKPKNVTFPLPLNIEVPKTWATVLLNDLAFVTKLAGFEYTKYINLKDSGEVPVIRAQNVRPFTPDLSNLKYIDMEISQALPRSCLDRPALLVTFIGAGIGDVCVLDEGQRWHLAPNVAKVEPYSNLNLRYLNIFISSPEGRKELFKSMKSTAQPSLSMTTIREIWFPIPPIEEQGRIVKKVEELMNLCDNLKVRFSESQITQLHLADAMAEDALA